MVEDTRPAVRWQAQLGESNLAGLARHGFVSTAERQDLCPIGRIEAGAALTEQCRFVETELGEPASQKLETEEVHLLEWSRLPRVAPFHRMIDGREIVGDRRRRGQHVMRES